MWEISVIELNRMSQYNAVQYNTESLLNLRGVDCDNASKFFIFTEH